MSTASTPFNLEMNDELAKTIAASVNQDEIKSAILVEAQRQIAEADKVAKDKAAEEKAAAERLAAVQTPAPVVTPTEEKTFSRKETIGGKEFTFEAESEEELNRAVINAYRVAFAVQPTPQEPAPVVPDAAEVARLAAEDAAAKTELETSFKRGDISAAEYIQKSGAIKEYLEQNGISLEAIKETVNETKTKTYEKSWADATTEFLSTPAGSSWPGGERNKNLLGMQLASMGLTDAQDKVGAMAQAYASLKQSGMLFPPDTAAPVVAAPVAAEPAAPVVPPPVAAPVVVAPPAKAAATSSSLFDKSSGTPTTTVQPAAAAQPTIDPNASPAEILDAWKKAQMAAGKNPNEAFDEAYRKR